MGLTQAKMIVILNSADAKTPKKATSGSAGYDLYASAEVIVPAKGRALVATDIIIYVPVGTYGRIAPRSGLAVKNGIDVGAGVIDSDYRGVVGVLLFNFSDVDYGVAKGDRIAQLIIEKIESPIIIERTSTKLYSFKEIVALDRIKETEDRGTEGFGSTGK